MTEKNIKISSTELNWHLPPIKLKIAIKYGITNFSKFLIFIFPSKKYYIIKIFFCKVNYMNLDDFLTSEENNILDEAKKVKSSDYPRYWHHFTPEEKEQYVKEGHKPKSGVWIYKHREALGLDYHDKRVVHHKNKNKEDFNKDNLVALTRAEHCQEEPNRKIYNDDEKCKVKGCGNSIYSHYLCFKHYMQKYREGKFGNYDPIKNKSKKNR